MTQKVKETTHMELAEVLAGNQVETENVLQALEMIRESIAFDGGAVYQAERSGRFYLAEQQAAGITDGGRQSFSIFLGQMPWSCRRWQTRTGSSMSWWYFLTGTKRSCRRRPRSGSPCSS